MTAHDFLDVGTGSKANTNWPGLPLSPNVPSQETDEDRPGRVYYVSTDQDGNFAVGNFFKVEQSTGKATLNANAFDLSGLDTLRLGAIGAQLGATINEFSTDGTLTQNSDEKVPTQKAVKTYVDGISSLTGNLTIAGNLTVNGTTTTVNSTTLTVDDKNIELGTVASPTDTTADGGGITLKGTTDKTINWINSTDTWNSSESFNLANGKSFRINNALIADATSLGASVVSSSLTSVGTLTGFTCSGNGQFTGTGQLKLHVGTTAERSGSPSAGMLRFNSDLNGFEGYNGSVWGGLGGGNPWATKTSAYTAIAGDRLFVDLSLIHI